jgi:hypothetical protein
MSIDQSYSKHGAPSSSRFPMKVSKTGESERAADGVGAVIDDFDEKD